MGAIDRNNQNEVGQIRVRLSTFRIHNSYDRRTINNDVAVMNFPAVRFTPRIQPIGLATGSENFAGSSGVTSGWGAFERGGPLPSNLMWVQARVITNTACANVFGTRFVVHSTICTNGITCTGTNCGGDSGGPLVTTVNGRTIQIGVVSFGGAASCSKYPSGFARVSSFVNWISSRTGLRF